VGARRVGFRSRADEDAKRLFGGGCGERKSQKSDNDGEKGRPVHKGRERSEAGEGSGVNSSVARRKSRNVSNAIGSPARERREVYVGTFSLRSRSELQPEIVILHVSEFVATMSVPGFLAAELDRAWRRGSDLVFGNVLRASMSAATTIRHATYWRTPVATSGEHPQRGYACAFARLKLIHGPAIRHAAAE
jgi:hypothetical protein